MDFPIKELFRTNLSAFTQKVFQIVCPGTPYFHAPYIDLMAEYLVACKNREITRLIINIPPRHLKSISIAVSFPAWLLGQNPSEQIMCASYSYRLSEKHSLECRLVLQQPWYKEIFPETQLTEDQNTKIKFVTTKRGHRIATSVNGTVTGEGGDFLIVDDALNAKDQMSIAKRDKANIWFDQAYATRLNDKKKGVIIVIMQRLHEDDLTGHLLRKGGWDHLCLPAIAEKDEVIEKGNIKLERKIDSLLHPERMGHVELERAKIELGSLAFAGQYQQRPSPEGGGEFRKEWLCFYEKLALHTLNFYLLIDPANTKKKKSDYTAMIVVGAGGDENWYIVDIIYDRLNPREREDTLFDLHKKYKPKIVACESYGMQCDIDWFKKAMEDRNYRFNIQPVGGMLSKTDRIRRLIRYFADHKIYLPRVLYRTDYNGKLTDVIDILIHHEYLAFPTGLHDDMLDALSRICDINIQYPGKNEIDYYEIYK
jgi:predicted phage terminase large subunit-like protein